MSITEIGTVGVPVTDQDRALEFYVGVLGFEKRMDAPFGPARWIEVVPPGARTSVALEFKESAGVDTGIRLTTSDAAADHEALRAAGVDVDAEIMRMEFVPPMFALRDPDGNRLILVERPDH